jgi:UDP-N-acetylglucosamine transferase subunit ALG13
MIDGAINFGFKYRDIKMVIQSGVYSPKLSLSSNILIENYFSFPQTQKYIERAKLVVSHGGFGTIMQVLTSGKKPVVVPRKVKLKEHANDHQLQLTNFLAKKGIIYVESDLIDLGKYYNGKYSLALPKDFRVSRKLLEENLIERLPPNP